MAEPTVRLDVNNGVARIELNRPDAANSINVELARELNAAVGRLAADPGAVRAVLLTGAGARFCAGGDVSAFATAGGSASELLGQITTALHPAIQQLVALDAPVVAAVQGSAAGAGFGLALASDFVIATRSAKFVVAFTGVGLSPDSSSSWFLPRIVGLRRSLELTLTNRVLSAEEAEEWGIVTQVVDDDRLMSTAIELVERLAQGPTKALGRAARLLREGLGRSLAEQLDAERSDLCASGATADGLEGIAAFIERRPPKFTGR